MRDILTGLLLSCTILPAAAQEAPAISYTEPHDVGSILIINEGTWNCGAMSDDRASTLMAQMANSHAKQAAIAHAGGCRRVMDENDFESPWKVVRRIDALCEDRTIEEGDEIMADGRNRRKSYLLCGREAHAIVIERDGQRRVAIDVVDLAAFD